MKEFKKPSEAELKKKLTPEQYEVTQNDATEAPFKNAYWDSKKAGIYVDIVSGEPLFSSIDKFDSGTGWPSFFTSLETQNIIERKDRKLFRMRTEVRSKQADGHLGHVFQDGPTPTGLRYCINSAALRFIEAQKLKEEGYEKFAAPFRATLAGGCFWGVEEIFRKHPGILETTVGYTGGTLQNPTYEDVKTGKTGHAETIDIIFDPQKISYEAVLKYFFRLHNPTTLNQQGNDIGTQYRSAIFYHDAKQKQIAIKVKEEVQKSGKWKGQVVTEIVHASPFYKAEDDHQKYLQKNPNGYTCHYLRK